MYKVRVALIGGGFVSDIHAEAFQEAPEAQLVAVCNVNKDALEPFARKWKIPNAFTDYR